MVMLMLNNNIIIVDEWIKVTYSYRFLIYKHLIIAGTSRAVIASSDGSGRSNWLGLCLLLTTAPPRGEQESHHTHSNHWNVVVEPEKLLLKKRWEVRQSWSVYNIMEDGRISHDCTRN